jgi:hypothetical protein
MYTKEILQFLGWPVMIWVSYKLAVWALKYYEKKYRYSEEEQNNTH